MIQFHDVKVPFLFPIQMSVNSEIKSRVQIRQFRSYKPNEKTITGDVEIIRASPSFQKVILDKQCLLIRMFNGPNLMFLEGTNYYLGKKKSLNIDLPDQKIESTWGGFCDFNGWLISLVKTFGGLTPIDFAENSKSREEFFAFNPDTPIQIKDFNYLGLTCDIDTRETLRNYLLTVESQIAIAHRSWQVPHSTNYLRSPKI